MTKRRPRGQCCHKRLVGNTTFFCIEPYGHQCEHSHYVSIDDLERLCAEARRAALTEAAEMLDRAQQPAAALGVIITRDKAR